MWNNISSDKCVSYIESHFGEKDKGPSSASIRPAITIARAEGSGGLEIASKLSEYLQKHTASKEVWTVFSQHLVAKVLEDHSHHARVADFMKEDHKGSLIDAVEELLGLHPSTWTLVEQTNATILRLSEMGNVILVGRGGNIVTSEMETAFHVYLISPFEKRVERAMEVLHLDEKAAVNYIKKKDRSRKRYIKDNFDKNIEDPLLYHLTINTDIINYDEAARLIGDTVIKRFELDHTVKAPVILDILP